MAKVLTGISGNLISAASAGFAPTNSADVSAIASAYQVVSSTATQLYAGTAYVTSVNDNQLSASRAGNAANASMANSAYYDGTGRLISALPDSATVSAIASSYAESAVSSKQDKLTFGYNTADQISSIDGSALGGMDEAAVSGIASAYAESAVSSVSGNYYTTANESGFLTAQVQASWSESASASPSYIVDKPDLVDIVAGPGIVVDNPDGNTLRVSTEADAETVLWENSDNTSNKNISLSESYSNFETLKFIWSISNAADTTPSNYNYGKKITYIPSETLGVANKFTLFDMMPDGASFNTLVIRGIAYTVASTTSLTVKGRTQVYYNGSSWSNNTTANVFVYKVVGIHRIAGGN